MAGLPDGRPDRDLRPGAGDRAGGARRPIRVAAGPQRAFSGLCGYDYARLADCLDLVLPKHYFWHRGFDRMYGTVARYVQTLCEWNPGLSEGGPCR